MEISKRVREERSRRHLWVPEKTVQKVGQPIVVFNVSSVLKTTEIKAEGKSKVGEKILSLPATLH